MLGAGGHAKVAAETAIACGAFKHIAFLDDRFTETNHIKTVFGSTVMGSLARIWDSSTRLSYKSAIVAIGDAKMRLHWLHQLRTAGYALPVLIHPQSWVSPSAMLGAGSVVFAQAAVQAGVKAGFGTVINTGSTVDHDTVLADGVHICPGAHLAGEVKVGSRSWIGIGASIIQRIGIGDDVTVGAGAVVVRDIPDGVTAVGVPARVILG